MLSPCTVLGALGPGERLAWAVCSSEVSLLDSWLSLRELRSVLSTSSRSGVEEMALGSVRDSTRVQFPDRELGPDRLLQEEQSGSPLHQKCWCAEMSSKCLFHNSLTMP